MAAERGPRLPVETIAEQLIGLYANAERQLDALISAAANRGAKGTARYYTNQQARVTAILRQLRRAREPVSAALPRAAYENGVAAIDRVVDTKSAFSGVHGAAIEVLAANLEGNLRYAEEFVGRRVQGTLRQIAIERVGVQVAAGQGPAEQRRDLVERLRAEGLTAFVDKRGRRWRLEAYASMVTRTTTREAASVGMKNRLIEHGKDLVMISEHRHACPICKAYQGKTYSLTGTSKNYPHLDRLPPFHPNCRHVLLPARVSFEQMEAALGLGPPEVPITAEAPTVDPKPTAKGRRAREGVFISEFMADGEREKIEDQLDAIDQVHSWPENMPEIGITTDADMGNTAGRFSPVYDSASKQVKGTVSLNRRILAGKTKIRELPGLDGKEINSTVHELGHVLDFNGLGNPRFSLTAVRRNRVESSAKSEAMEAWRVAVRSSEAYKRLRRYYTERDYTLKLIELWARSYEQWIALRSENAAAQRKIDDLMAGGRDDAYWTREDFESIAAALDRVFAEAGLLKPAKRRDADED